MNKLVFLGILFFQIFTLSNIVNGQQDSLFQIISHGSRLEDKIDAHRRIMELLPRSEVDSLKLHFDAMLALSKQLNDENILESTYYDGIDFYYLNYAVQGANELHEEFKNFLKKQNDTLDVINVLIYQGLLFNNKQKPAEALKYLKESEEMVRQLLDENVRQKKMSVIYHNMAMSYKVLLEYGKGLDVLFKSLAIKQKRKDSINISNTYGIIANYYGSMGLNEKSIEFNEKALSIALTMNDKRSMAAAYNNLAGNLMEADQLEKVEPYLLNAIKLNQKENNVYWLSINYQTISEYYHSKNEIDKSIHYLRLAHQLNLKHEQIYLLISTYSNLSSRKLENQEIDSSLFFGLKSYNLAKQENDLESIKSTAKILSSAYDAKGNIIKAYRFLNTYSILNDSLNFENDAIDLVTKETTNKFRTQMMKDSLVSLNQELILRKEIEKEQLAKEAQEEVMTLFVWIGIILAILSLVMVFAYLDKRKNSLLILKQKEEVEHQKELLEEKNREVTDSIFYAKRLQQAILPPIHQIQKALPNHFIYFSPKDIVSGDFYWMEASDKKVLFAAADCTGHGVPGAMVSVIGANGLKRCVREFALENPAEILDKLSHLVEETFDQSADDVKDGMDIALCSLEGTKLSYAGANNPLWVARKKSISPSLEIIQSPTSSPTPPITSTDKIDLFEIKADKQPVGKHDLRKPFTSWEIQLEKGDNVYVFSDGYADQFGGVKGKKFRNKRMRELILSIQDLTMKQQRVKIENDFVAWKGDLEQLDDVCVFGVKV